MRDAVALLGLAAAMAINMPAVAQQHTPMTGMELYNYCDSKIVEIQSGCEMYVFGFFEGYAVAQQARETGYALICLRGGESPVQLRLIVQKAMRDHPEILNYPAGVITTRSLVDAFKCGPGEKPKYPQQPN
jgi:hypothetical protein